ncbi:hypothetical protein F2Q70_00007622 [Brassica cretica]|uniref:Pentacotripeptide-repeat region of PRORP domain-containing protein n=1 Tax=Brassica cretica TaxID=69181 RepID=A0A8S9M8B6_BRACR|nr:hypothetical protein F2Q70_00007622 [Brassica cretica]
MFSLWFFRWLCSTFDYKPDSVSLSLLFGSLLDARAAKGFLDSTGFNPEVTLLERYVKCLCKDGLVDEGGEVSQAYELLKKSLKQGLDPGHAVYPQLISGFCKIGSYASMSETLHTMIAWNHLRSIYTYPEVLKGCVGTRSIARRFVYSTISKREATHLHHDDPRASSLTV